MTARRISRVHVIGAGMVGVCCALALTRRGFDVTLVDRREPGQETSSGNAGVIGTGSIFPINNPGLWRTLPALLRNTKASLRFDPAYLLSHPRWVAGFLAHATPASTRRRAGALHGLICRAAAAHRALMHEAGIVHRLRETGWLRLFRSEASFARSAPERRLLEDFGVAFEVLDATALREMEPGLNPVFVKAIWYVDSASVDSPGDVVEAYARLFTGAGGRFLQQPVHAIAARGGGLRLHTGGGDIDTDRVVVALGPWSCDLLQPLGYRFPLGFERGYHRHFLLRDAGALTRPVHDVDGAYVMTPTRHGLRVLSGVELKARDAPDSPDQLDALLPRVHEAIALAGPTNTATWRGARPSLPDELPVIGEAPRHPGLWLAFGHQHVGFSTGAITGNIVAAMMSGEDPGLDVLAYSPQRFV